MSSVANAYNQWSQSYDEVANKTRDLDRKAVEEVLGRINRESVLELGCGTGKNTIWFAEQADTVLAVDFSEGMLAIAAAKVAAANVTFQQADITRPWTFPQKRFDLVSCNLMLEHIEDLNSVFGNAAQSLADGGHLFISELHPFKQYAGSKARFEQDGETVVLDCYTHHISDYLQAAAQAGLALVELKEWFDEENKDLPRLLTLLFQKKGA